MTKLTIRQKKSLFNQQAITHAVKKCTLVPFKIKRKGKHCFYITFSDNVNRSLANQIANKLGLQVDYQSDVRCIISDNYDKALV